MRGVEFAELGEEQYAALVGEEEDPWGTLGRGVDLEWRRKEHHVALFAGDALIAAAGLVVVDAELDGPPAIPVVGIGGVIVASRYRGRGLGDEVISRAIRRAGQLGPESAMLFCLPDRVGLYERHGFATVDGPVVVDQPAAPVEMPIVTMWRPLTPRARTPRGAVRLIGLPF